LSAAILTGPVINCENVHLFVAEIQRLLADRVIETEEGIDENQLGEGEPAGTQESNQKGNTRTEAQEVSGNPKKIDAEKLSKKEIEEGANPLEPSASENSSVIAAKAEPVTSLTQSELMRPTKAAAKAKATDSPSNSSSDTIIKDSAGAPEKLVVTSNSARSSERGSVINEIYETSRELTGTAPSVENQLNEIESAIKSKDEARQQIPTSEIPEAETAANRIVEQMSPPDKIQFVTNRDAGFLTLPEAIETVTQPQPTEPSPLDLESLAVSDDVTELTDKIEVTEDESAITNFAEETSFSQLGNESNLSRQMEIDGPEQLIQISLTIEEIEDSLIQLTEHIKASEPEIVEKANEILDKIIEVPAKFKAHNSQNIITESEAQEELEELFTELLDKMGIDYTPELVESLAHLTLNWHLADEIEKLKDEEETDKTPQERGTHEIIKKLLKGLSMIKKAITHACAIGKSALQLYNFDFAA
jgi:hypothetical protein